MSQIHTISFVDPKTPKLGQSQDPPPSFPQQLLGLAATSLDWAKSGFKVASDEQFKERMDFCNSCEFFDKEAFMGAGKCNKCGCRMLSKARMATSFCPINKWSAVSPIEI